VLAGPTKRARSAHRAPPREARAASTVRHRRRDGAHRSAAGRRPSTRARPTASVPRIRVDGDGSVSRLALLDVPARGMRRLGEARSGEAQGPEHVLGHRAVERRAAPARRLPVARVAVRPEAGRLERQGLRPTPGAGRRCGSAVPRAARRARPRWRRASAVNGFVIDAIRNGVSASTGASRPSSSTPSAAKTVSPSRKARGNPWHTGRSPRVPHGLLEPQPRIHAEFATLPATQSRPGALLPGAQSVGSGDDNRGGSWPHQGSQAGVDQ